MDTYQILSLLATTFTITISEPCKQWAFDIENDNIKGHWIGTFTEKMDRQKLILQKI